MIKNKFSSFNRDGFTLIELLVVISIISLLSSIVLSSLNNARAAGRDAKRIAELNQVKNALEQYRNKHGAYPTNGFWYNSVDHGVNWLPNSLITEGFISKIPVDPVNTGGTSYNLGNYSYNYSSFDGQRYTLFTNLETNHPLRCELKCYKFSDDHQVPGTVNDRTGQDWCGTTTSCGGTPDHNYSSQMYHAVQPN